MHGQQNIKHIPTVALCMCEQYTATVSYSPIPKCLHSHFPGKLILKWRGKKLKLGRMGKGYKAALFLNV
jgi:hypothetical protein